VVAVLAEYRRFQLANVSIDVLDKGEAIVREQLVSVAPGVILAICVDRGGADQAVAETVAVIDDVDDLQVGQQSRRNLGRVDVPFARHRAVAALFDPIGEGWPQHRIVAIIMARCGSSRARYR
jgi:fructose-bisphosphate aldolase class 1